MTKRELLQWLEQFELDDEIKVKVYNFSKKDEIHKKKYVYSTCCVDSFLDQKPYIFVEIMKKKTAKELRKWEKKHKDE